MLGLLKRQRVKTERAVGIADFFSDDDVLNLFRFRILDNRRNLGTQEKAVDYLWDSSMLL